MNKNTISVLINCAVTALLGLLFIFVNPVKLMHIVLIVVGIFIVLVNLPTAIFGLLTTNDTNKVKYTEAIISTIIGLMLIFWQNHIANIIVAVWFILLPVIRIVKSASKKLQFKKELPQLLVGVILIIFGPWSILDVLFKVIGGIIIFIAIVELVLFFVAKNKEKKDSNIIDATIINERDVK